MSLALQVIRDETTVTVRRGDGAPLWRYVYVPDTPGHEAPRPYAHPVYAPAGDVLTNFRPNDHPWHHGLSLTVTNVSGVNFWGGPSYRPADRYQWRNDQGRQVHRSWVECSAGRLEQRLDWCGPGERALLLHENRVLATTVGEGEWSLRWTSELQNVTGRVLTLDHYESAGGLSGSHYTGLQFRGARGLLDAHGDDHIGLGAEGGLKGEAAVHTAETRWMEWHCQHDGSLRRTRIRFENLTGPVPWFVREKNPLVAIPFHGRSSHTLAVDATLRLDHRLTFFSA
jgi:hypothetical protein